MMRNQQSYNEEKNNNGLSNNQESEHSIDRDRQQGVEEDKKRHPNDEKGNKDTNRIV